jgi:hypothetical protein
MPQLYQGRVILYKTEERYRDRQLRWGDFLTPERLEIQELDTHHDNVFKEPYVQTFAERLRAPLSDAQMNATKHRNSA